MVGFLSFVFLCGCVAAEHTPILIGLKSQNLQKADSRFWQIATPGSGGYLSYPSPSEIKDLFACPEHELDVLVEWLHNRHATDILVTPDRDWLTASVPQKEATFLKEQFQLLPLEREIPSVIDVVLARDPNPSSTLSVKGRDHMKVNQERHARMGTAKASVSGDINAQRTAYGVPVGYKASNPNNKQMVWGTGTYGISQTDIATFFSAYNIQNDPSLIVTKGFPGDITGDNAAEASLDVEYLAGIANNVETVLWNNDNRPIAEAGIGMGDAMLEFMHGLNSGPKEALPVTLSISLGSMSWYSCNLWCNKLVEAHPGEYSYKDCYNYSSSQFQVCVYATKDIEDRISTEFMKLGMKGVTILAATGDGGAHFSFQKFPPFEKIGRDLNEVCCNYTFATFPGESPYIVGVGGTEWRKTSANDPYTWPATGGAFSWGYDAPSHQQQEIEQYITDNEKNPIFPYDYQFNRKGRAIPDIAALADGIPFYWGGSNLTSGGTSFSAPEWSGIISLVNDNRLNLGLPPLGPVAARLYDVARKFPGEAFFDIVSGDNRFQADGRKCETGFVASKGWDAVTGLGRPIFDGLMKHLGDDAGL